MRIVHFSDWHAERMALPAADLYVCTGDMYPDGPGLMNGDRAAEYQMNWVEENGPIKLEAPVLCVRGNHDFADLDLLFEAPKVFEICRPSDAMYKGDLYMGGTRGVRWLGGHWSDELYDPELAGRLRGVGPVDVLLTHGPAYGGLDAKHSPTGGHVGSRALRSYLRRYEPIVHFHGHCHGAFGTLFNPRTGLTTVNSACGWSLVDVKSDGYCRVIEQCHMWRTVEDIEEARASDPGISDATLAQLDADYDAAGA